MINSTDGFWKCIKYLSKNGLKKHLKAIVFVLIKVKARKKINWKPVDKQIDIKLENIRISLKVITKWLELIAT